MAASETRGAVDGPDGPARRIEPEVREGIIVLGHCKTISGESFDPKNFQRLYRSEERSFWFRGRSDLINWALRRYFATRGRLLEIGCGTGYVLGRLNKEFPELVVAGSELFFEGLQFARRRLPQSVYLYQMDATQMPFFQEFDVIGAFDVLEHIREDRKVLDNAYHALKPGGGLLITVPQHPWLWSDTDLAAHHVRRYRKSNLVSLVEDAGFTIERVTSFVSLLLPAMLLSRLRRRGGMDKVEAELNLPSVLNAVGYFTLRLEAALIRAGISLPFGGSLLVVARRPMS